MIRSTFRITGIVLGWAALVAAMTLALAGCDTTAPPPTAPPAAKETAQDGGTCALEDAEGFDIDVRFLGSDWTTAQKETILAAARRWESVITAGLPDADYSQWPYNKYHTTSRQQIRYSGRVDDLIVFVTLAQLSDRTARAAPISVRNDGFLPTLAVITIDPESMVTAERGGWFDLVILHEIGHALGLGTVWNYIGLETCKTDSAGQVQPHFTGWGARWAFNLAGGDSYSGARVPVAADRSHWSAAVMGDELMVDSLPLTARAPLSVITIAALGDLGYKVDPSQADPYEVPSPEASAKATSAPLFECGVGLH